MQCSVNPSAFWPYMYIKTWQLKWNPYISSFFLSKEFLEFWVIYNHEIIKILVAPI